MKNETATLMWHVPELPRNGGKKIETVTHLPSYLTQTHTLSEQLKAVFSYLPGNNKASVIWGCEVSL